MKHLCENTDGLAGQSAERSDPWLIVKAQEGYEVVRVSVCPTQNDGWFDTYGTYATLDEARQAKAQAMQRGDDFPGRRPAFREPPWKEGELIYVDWNDHTGTL